MAGVGILSGMYLVLTRDAGPLFPGGALPEASPAENGFALEQNQPNPFGQTTAIVYRIPEEDRVTLRVYNTLGAPVITLVDYVQAPGFHEVEWDGRDPNGNRLPGGVYFYQLSAGGRQELRRMVLLP
ncbi:MAG: T9SS type A sorting domain-containing protein [Gemmatimonadetes bacterium]|nr:T9SS type A sorting domain-containing protein [Gemmatimonadota bacterium]